MKGLSWFVLAVGVTLLVLDGTTAGDPAWLDTLRQHDPEAAERMKALWEEHGLGDRQHESSEWNTGSHSTIGDEIRQRIAERRAQFEQEIQERRAEMEAERDRLRQTHADMMSRMGDMDDMGSMDPERFRSYGQYDDVVMDDRFGHDFDTGVDVDDLIKDRMGTFNRERMRRSMGHRRSAFDHGAFGDRSPDDIGAGFEDLQDWQSELERRIGSLGDELGRGIGHDFRDSFQPNPELRKRRRTYAERSIAEKLFSDIPYEDEDADDPSMEPEI